MVKGRYWHNLCGHLYLVEQWWLKHKDNGKLMTKWVSEHYYHEPECLAWVEQHPLWLLRRGKAEELGVLATLEELVAEWKKRRPANLLDRFLLE